MTRLHILAVAAVLLVVPASAVAQTPVTSAPTPAPAAGKASIALKGGQIARRGRYVAAGGPLRVIGRVSPVVAGQTVVVEITRGRRTVARKRVAVGSGGRISVRMRTPSGRLAVRIVHAATAQQAAFRSRRAFANGVVASAGEGSRGLNVLLLQRGLAGLGYVVPLTGYYDNATSRAVLAYNKVNGGPRNGFASRSVFSLVLQGRGGFRLRFPRAGRHVEFDWSRQVLVLADGGRARRIYHASSGKPSTPTVFGTFRFYRKEPGTNSHGMVNSTYFIGGYAIHGYASVPAYAASHGCIRVPIPNALGIYRQIALGEPIMVYR